MASSVDSDWVDVPHQSSDSDWQDVQPQQDSLLDRSANAIRGAEDWVGQKIQPAMDAISPYLASQEGSPSSLLQSVPPLLNKAAGTVGQGAAEALAQPNNRLFKGKPYDAGTISPTVAGAFGTAVSMAPDVAMSAINPEAGAVNNEFAQTQALRAMGAPKRMFKTPQMIDRAKGQAQTLLDQGAISGSATGMADKLGDLESSSGQKIGDILNQFKDQGKFYNLQDGIDAIEALRPHSQNGQLLQGGQYDIINRKIDNAVATIKAHGPQEYNSSNKIIKGSPTTDRIQNGVEVIPRQSSTEMVPNGYGIQKGIEEEKPETNMWTGQPVSKPYNAYSPRPGNSIFGKSKEVSVPGQNTVVGKSQEVQVPGQNTVVTKGAKPINWTGQQPVPTINFDEANQLKGRLQDAANYGSNKEATLLDKVIAGKFRESLDNSLGKAANDIQDPALAQEFQKHKQIYGATQFGKDAVYNKLASELANKKIGLTDWILGSHALASGNPLTAVAEVGGKKLLEKYGASTAANVSNKLSKTPDILGRGNAANAAGAISQEVQPQSGWTKDKEARLQELRRKQQDGTLGN